MCNLYSMTATVDEMKRLFGPLKAIATISLCSPRSIPAALHRSFRRKRKRSFASRYDDLGISWSCGCQGPTGHKRPQSRQPILAIGARATRSALHGSCYPIFGVERAT